MGQYSKSLELESAKGDLELFSGFDMENDDLWSSITVQEPMPLFSGTMNSRLPIVSSTKSSNQKRESKRSNRSGNTLDSLAYNFSFLTGNTFTRRTFNEDGNLTVDRYSTVTVQGQGAYFYDLKCKLPIFSFSIPQTVVLSCPVVSLVFDAPELAGQQYAAIKSLNYDKKSAVDSDIANTVWRWPIQIKAQKTERSEKRFPEPVLAIVPDNDSKKVYVVSVMGTLYVCSPTLEIEAKVSLTPPKVSCTLFGVFPASDVKLGSVESAASLPKLYTAWKSNNERTGSKGSLLYLTAFSADADDFKMQALNISQSEDMPAAESIVNMCFYRENFAMLVSDRILTFRIEGLEVRLLKVLSFAQHGFQLAQHDFARLSCQRLAYLDKGYMAVVLNKTFGKSAKLSGDLLTVWDGEYGTLQYAKPLRLANFDAQMTMQALVDLSSTFSLRATDDSSVLNVCATVNLRTASNNDNFGKGDVVLFGANAEMVRYDVPAISLLSCVGKLRSDANFAQSAGLSQSAFQESLEALQDAISQANVGLTEQHAVNFIKCLNDMNSSKAQNRAQVVSFVNAAFRSLLAQIDLSRRTQSGGYWPVRAVQMLLESGLVSSMMVNRAILVPMISEKAWSLIQLALEHLVDVSELELVALTDALCQESMRPSLYQWSQAPVRSALIYGPGAVESSEDTAWFRTVEFFFEKMYWDRSFIVEEFVHGFKRLSLEATSFLLAWACSYVKKRALSHSLLSQNETTLRTMVELLSALLDAQGTCLLMAPTEDSAYDRGFKRLSDVREQLMMAYAAIEEAAQLLMPSLIKYDQAWRSHRHQQKSSSSSVSKWQALMASNVNDSLYSLELLSI